MTDQGLPKNGSSTSNSLVPVNLLSSTISKSLKIASTAPKFISSTPKLLTPSPKILTSIPRVSIASALENSGNKNEYNLEHNDINEDDDNSDNNEDDDNNDNNDDGNADDDDNIDSNEKDDNVDDGNDCDDNGEDDSLNRSSPNRLSRVDKLPTSTKGISKRFSLSPHRLMTSLSRRASLSPLRQKVSNTSTNLVINKTDSRPQAPIIEKQSVEGISRSFAGFLTTASVYAGFQDIEDEEREIGSSLEHSESSLGAIDTSIPQVVGANKDKVDEEYDNTDNFDYNLCFPSQSQSEHDSIITAKAEIGDASDKYATLKNDNPLNRSDERIPEGTQSKFDLSIVKKLIKEDGKMDELSRKRAAALSKKLRETFGISEMEEFVGDYPCWLMGDVLLQGHLYITDLHILFFAFLPKKNRGTISKTGSLSIKSYHSLRLHRKWAILRENTLSIYSNSTDLYFPELVIDLRTALRAEIYGSQVDATPTEPVWLRVITENRTHWFQADNLDAARIWVTAIKKQIFSSRNKGDQVAIKIPLPNIVDLELTQVIGITKNLRIKVIENADSFAIDDYFVMFFSQGDQAVSEIKKVIQSAGVEISTVIESDDDQFLESEIMKSKIELLKKSASSVKSTNYKPRKRKKTFSAIKGVLLSGDEASDSDLDNYIFSGDDYLIGDDQISAKAKGQKSRSNSYKAVDMIPALSKSTKLEIVEDSTDKMADLGDIPQSLQKHNRWSTMSLVQGITSFTQSLISAGPILHYDENSTLAREGEDPYFVKDQNARNSSTLRFIKKFSLNEHEKLIATYHAYLIKGLPTYGKIYIGTNVACFRSTIPGSNTIMILPLLDIENITKENGFRFGYCGLVIVIQGHEELFFEFSSHEARSDCEFQIMKRIDMFKKSSSDDSNLTSDSDEHCKLAGSSLSLTSAKIRMFENKLTDEIGIDVPIIVEDHPLKKTNLKPSRAYRFTLLTIGSRGDVQPYIALGIALMKEGHKVKIVTHKEFENWVRSYGIDFATVAGDPAELMALMVTHPSINYAFIREAKSKFRTWIDDLLLTSWNACQDTDVLIESPSSIAGIHIAEKLQVAYFRAFTMPWTRTRAYPHAFMVPDQKLGGAYNYMTHVAFENGYWRGTSYQVNKWRVDILGLPKTTLAAMHQTNVPFLYNISPVVFPPSVDFAEWVKVTGYWFLNESPSFKPKKELVDFIKKARDDGKKLVYIGFGSIVVENPKQLTQAVVDAVLEAGICCILNKGWSNRLGSKTGKEIEINLPHEVFNAGSIPHDWLFPQMDAAVHHGGSGTTGTSLKFGLPTVIKPFFGDQKFYAGRVEDLGCGIALKNLSSKSLSKALKEVTTNTRIIEKAKQVGKKISAENGVRNAINVIYTKMDYAKKLSVSKSLRKIVDEPDDDTEEVEGSWMLI